MKAQNQGPCQSLSRWPATTYTHPATANARPVMELDSAIAIFLRCESTTAPKIVPQNAPISIENPDTREAARTDLVTR